MTLYEDLLELEKSGLVIGKRLNGRVLFKYHNKVFYNNLWNVSPALLEARGIVFDEDTGECLQRPFHKIFNVGENGTQEPDSDHVKVMKVNSFMCAASVLDNGELFVTTTGSMDSDFVDLATKWVNTLNVDKFVEGYTYLFEVCDKTDPHIVDEQEGIYLLSIRRKYTGSYIRREIVEDEQSALNSKVINWVDISDTKEGWVYYDNQGTPVAKTKTPHYLSKKALMRMGKKSVDQMYDHPELFKQRLDEEFYEVYDYLTDTYTKDVYASFSEQERRQIIERYFYE